MVNLPLELALREGVRACLLGKRGYNIVSTSVRGLLSLSVLLN